MKSKYKTFLTRKAYNDLRGIYGYIREELQNNSAAINIVNEIEERIRLLEDTVLHAKGYRKLIDNNYISLYTVNNQNKEVHIIRIIYGKRDYRKLI